MKFMDRSGLWYPRELIGISAQKIGEDCERGAADLFGLGLEDSIAGQPVRLGLMMLAPEGLQDAFRALDLLHGGGERFPPFRQIGDVADKKPGDATLVKNSFEQHDDRLFVRIPALRQHGL